MKPGSKTYVGKILKPGANTKGYLQAHLYIDNRKCVYPLISKLVAKHFIGPCPTGKEVNHKDLNPLNNCVKNLEYVTHSVNIKHAHKNGVKFGFGKGKKNPRYRLKAR